MTYKQKAEEYLKRCHPDLDKPIMAFADFLDNQTPKIAKLEEPQIVELAVSTHYHPDHIKVVNKINEIIDHLT